MPEKQIIQMSCLSLNYRNPLVSDISAESLQHFIHINILLFIDNLKSRVYELYVPMANANCLVPIYTLHYSGVITGRRIKYGCNRLWAFFLPLAHNI